MAAGPVNVKFGYLADGELTPALTAGQSLSQVMAPVTPGYGDIDIRHPTSVSRVKIER